MRICLYTSTALPKTGGQEIAVDHLARQYQAAGHEVIVLAPKPRLPLRPRDEQLPYHVVRHPRLFSTRYFVDWYAWWLLRLHAREAFDVVHCHGVYPQGYLATRSRARLGVPVVITSHGDDVFAGNHRLRCPRIRGRIRSAIRQADHLIAISSFTEEGYRQLGADRRRITVISNGVDADRLRQAVPRPADLAARIEPDRYVLFLGRLILRKGVDVLLSALRQVPATGKIDVVIAGVGEERDALERMTRQLELSERVYFVGSVQDEKKAWLLQNARCLVVPSRTWEAQGIVALEAFAAGVPVIASNLQGLADLIEPGHTGWLVPPEDSTALAEALRQTLSVPVPEEMSVRVRKVAARLTWSAIAGRHVELFEELLGPVAVSPEQQRPRPSGGPTPRERIKVPGKATDNSSSRPLPASRAER
jgi:glycosyltransferase involved in cell wall biosynthesis